MKITYRVPTRQYAYMEVEQEGMDLGVVGSTQTVVDNYFKLEDEYKKQQAERDATETPFEDDVQVGIGKSRNEYLKKKVDLKIPLDHPNEK